MSSEDFGFINLTSCIVSVVAFFTTVILPRYVLPTFSCVVVLVLLLHITFFSADLFSFANRHNLYFVAHAGERVMEQRQMEGVLFPGLAALTGGVHLGELYIVLDHVTISLLGTRRRNLTPIYIVFLRACFPALRHVAAIVMVVVQLLSAAAIGWPALQLLFLIEVPRCGRAVGLVLKLRQRCAAKQSEQWIMMYELGSLFLPTLSVAFQLLFAILVWIDAPLVESHPSYTPMLWLCFTSVMMVTLSVAQLLNQAVPEVFARLSENGGHRRRPVDHAAAARIPTAGAAVYRRDASRGEETPLRVAVL